VRVAVVGATGAVGSTILGVMRERSFAADEVVPFASERSAGRTIDYGDTDLTVVALSDEAIQGFDLALFSAGSAISADWAPKFADAGAVVVDNSSQWRMHDDVPLVVSEVNPDALASHRGIVANPNCTTMQTVMALGPILRAAGIERVVMSSYQAVSGTGQRAVEELHQQAEAVIEAKELPAPAVYPHQIAFNVLPQVETFKDGDDYTTEERKCMRETSKILGRDDIGVSATCARVPVFTGHSVSANVQTREPLSPDECRELLSRAPGVTVIDDPANGLYPTALDAAGRDDVLVGRIRRDPSHEPCAALRANSANAKNARYPGPGSSCWTA
jgi:aspartate-semialdehyde dehydrogenase